MSKFPIKSVLEQIAQSVFTMKDTQQARTFIYKFLSDKNIKEADKMLIIGNVNKCTSMIKIQQYICNSLLKYEGMSVNLTTKKEAA